MCKEVSHVLKKIKYGKRRLRNSRAQNLNKRKMTKTSIRRNKNKTMDGWEDWKSKEYLMPLAFLKGILSEWDMFKPVTTILELILTPTEKLIEYGMEKLSNLICEAEGEKEESLLEKTTSAIKEEFLEGDYEKLSEEYGKFQKKLGSVIIKQLIKFKNYIRSLFTGQQEVNKEKKVEQKLDFCNLDFSFYKTVSICDSVKSAIDSNIETDKVVISDIGFSSKLINGPNQTNESQKSFSIEIKSPFFVFQITDVQDDFKEKYFTCVFNKIDAELEKINDKVKDYKDGEGKNAECSFSLKYGKRPKWDESKKSYNGEISSFDSTCNNELKLAFEDSKLPALFSNDCKTELLNYVSKTKAEIEDYNTKKKLCEDKKKKEEEEEKLKKDGLSFLPTLYEFTKSVLKMVGKCIVVSIFENILKKGVEVILSFLANFLTGALFSVMKVVWYLGKLVYNLYKAWSTDDTTGTPETITKAKREIASYYGVSVAAIIKTILAIVNLEKKKQHKKSFKKRIYRRRSHK